ncbi:hypothetical protein [Streptomyces yatensis]|uniref:Prepilin type IV endopeptidase peptidase domain-containing protein n=1 Tax=Streptomyces yatensis TaxID=155177 RepID=A0ABP4UIX2_9ACTN|nr:hypothetical protein [Streptomyces yatensis]
MTTTDYLISVALIPLVIPQIRGTRQTPRNALLPVVAVAAAAAYYLRSFPTEGHDVQLDLVGVLAGAALGAACGAATGVRRGSDGVALAKAGAVAAALWIVGMAVRPATIYEDCSTGRAPSSRRGWATHAGP